MGTKQHNGKETMVKTLPALEGTEYEVEVIRDENADYEVHVFKPADNNDPWVELEPIGARWLGKDATREGLNSLVEEIIRQDRPSLVGNYIWEKESVDGN